LSSVVGETAVVRFVASSHRGGTDNFAVVRRPGLYIDGDQFVRTIAETFHAKCPNIDALFLTFDACEVR
jgi:hypothetical protein